MWGFNKITLTLYLISFFYWLLKNIYITCAMQKHNGIFIKSKINLTALLIFT